MDEVTLMSNPKVSFSSLLKMTSLLYTVRERKLICNLFFLSVLTHKNDIVYVVRLKKF